MSAVCYYTHLLKEIISIFRNKRFIVSFIYFSKIHHSIPLSYMLHLIFVLVMTSRLKLEHSFDPEGG